MDIPAVEDDNIVVVNGHDHTNGHHRSTSNGGHIDIPLRSKKSIAKRASRYDGATILAQNQCYSVKLLPSTPKELRREGFEYRGRLGHGNQALAVTQNKAMVWDYTGATAASNLRVFDIPFQSKPRDPLPFGALVASSVSSANAGLVLLSATTGRVVFYESVDRAASFGLFQDHKNGIEGTIGSLFSGETITDIIPADHAGFVVVLSSGRLAHLTLRDAQGKPRIFSQFLRISEPNAGGLFGSIKGLWNSGFSKNLSAVHTRPTTVRGQMEVVSLTESAEFLLWDLDWSGRCEYKTKIECKEVLLNELKSILEVPELAIKTENITALDFAIITRPTSSSGQEIALANAELPLEVFLLLRVGTANQHEYVLIELSLAGEETTIIRTSPLSNYRAHPAPAQGEQPRLLLPRPGHTVMVVFHDAVVLHAAQGFVSETPDAQLRSSLIQPELFSETIHLQTRPELAIVNSSEEDPRGPHASCITFVKSFGLVRFSAIDIYASNTVARISAKSRLEQAVFYGLMQNENIIDFASREKAEHPLDEIEDAALAISDEILRADTGFPSFISSSPTSMEQHLAAKLRALKSLISYVAQNYPALSRTTSWRLLADAERVAAAQQLWNAFEAHVAATSHGKRKATLLDELCTWFEGDDKFPHRADLANEDPVRRFFIGGLHRLEKLLLNVRVLLQSLKTDTSKTPEVVLRLVAQANDVWLRALNTAFAFRAENSATYGILPEFFDNGLLVDPAEYVDAPEFWTSTEKLVDATVTIASLSREFANSLFEGPELTEASVDLVREISQWNPKIVGIYCTQFRECISWRASRPSEKDREHARRLEAAFEVSRYEQLRKLADVGQVNAGMALAEKLRDMNTLTDMVIAEDQYLSDMSLEGLEVAEQVTELENKIERYFEQYQEEWRNLFFDKLFSGGAEGKMLMRAQLNWRDDLTVYLRAEPSRAKICWINDVTEQKDYRHASDVLIKNAQDLEGHLWAKKVELSLSKLALLAAEEEEPSNAVVSNGTKDTPRNELILVDLQERLYRHVHPTIVASIDRQASVELCVNAFGTSVGDFPSLRQLFENSIEHLLEHLALPVEELIDLFTLMDCINDEESESNLQGAEFYLALQALDAAAPGMPSARVETLLRLIWKRCYAFDDWARLGLSGKQSDEDRLAVLRQTAPWSVYYRAFSSGFFDNANSQVRPLTPSECLGAACAAQDLSYRFPDEDLLDPILHDIRVHDEVLQGYIVDRRLDTMAEECLRDAKEFVAAEAELRARTLQEERAFQEGYTEGGADGSSLLNGHTGTNGHSISNGFKPGELAVHDEERSEMEMTD